jgi:hypothetical protein
LGAFLKAKEKSSSSDASENQLPGFSIRIYNTRNTLNQMSLISDTLQPEKLVNDRLPRADNQSVGR